MNEFESDELKRAYNLLDVQHSASAGAIKHSYRRMAKRWHPDRYSVGSPAYADATQMMKRINEAYSLIENAPLSYQSQETADDCSEADSGTGKFWTSLWEVVSLSPFLMKIVGIPFAILAVWLIFVVTDHLPGLLGAIPRAQSWVISLGVAIAICCVAAEEFWAFRRKWYMWLLFAGVLILHFLVAIPAFERIGFREVGELRLRGSALLLFAAFEIAIAAAILHCVSSSLSKDSR